MFRKIISNLPFSTALVEQLGVYAKKIKNEENTRKLGLFFVVLTIIVQSFILMQPPESANASDNIIDLKNSSTALQKNGFKLSIAATNTTQGFVDASNVLAAAQEQISYTITVQNPSAKSKSIEISNNISDLLEYADLIDDGGGTLNSVNGQLSWPMTTIDPSSIQTRTYTIRLFTEIPATAKNAKNSQSFDCKLTNIFGNTLDINVSCPLPKIAEQIITVFPKINQINSTLIAIIILIIAVYFYARTRQIKQEIHLIRKDMNSGTI